MIKILILSTFYLTFSACTQSQMNHNLISQPESRSINYLETSNLTLAASLSLTSNPPGNSSFISPYSTYLDVTTDPNEEQHSPSFVEAAAIITLSVLIAIGTSLGNALLLLAIAIVRRLHQPCNILICSLASSNLLIALTVEPFVAYKGVSPVCIVSFCCLHS